ncbi:hypothetical protein JG687_00010050 [Phytophthora cactorum]|uniref:Uncharacterized protein n=1 Tax=Phytophthora cactorum TaxID=29920 RepID=A0A8T1UAJ0_9STRA|nr:hypothetical protein GQ600_5306 [Phytophthora cactorum]KAG2778724.1 hypothetical protein Pcac1_g10955 [Phytophthora cactorum]KAG6957328.1 hypothetical protein JG687_00010050 [Phytophthora cactorum]
MMQSLPVRMSPGQPRNISRALIHDGQPAAFYDVDNPVAILLANPSRLLKFSVLIQKSATKENEPGIVSTWMNR